MNENVMEIQEAEQEIVIEKPYKFVKLTTTHLFVMIRLVKKVGLTKLTEVFMSEGFQNAFNSQKRKKATENDFLATGKAMFQIAELLLDRIGDCEKEIIDMLSCASNLTVDEIKELDMNTFVDMIFDFVKKDDFMGFFTHVLSLLNKTK